MSLDEMAYWDGCTPGQVAQRYEVEKRILANRIAELTGESADVILRNLYKQTEFVDMKWREKIHG
jgi:hypothetical protein